MGPTTLAKVTPHDRRVPEQGKVYVVDTACCFSPDAIQHLANGNTVIIPFPVLQDSIAGAPIQRRWVHRAPGDPVLSIKLQADASADELKDGIPPPRGLLRFHGGELDVSRAWPGFAPAMPTTRSSCWPVPINSPTAARR